ncbi:MAG: thiamine phosphate synthase [Chitinophagales bacterium]|nr:thiamine phosphate synthase [Chitinophagales bacterium]
MDFIIYTASDNFDGEIDVLTQLLEYPNTYLYIRKPELDDFSLVDFVEQIPEKYWQQCVTTSLIITKEFDLAGYHFTRDILSKNTNYNQKVIDWLHQNHKISSASAHDIATLQQYKSQFKHLILSPFFPSISKVNHQNNWNMTQIKDELLTERTSKIFAVGGIQADNINQIKSYNINGIGLLGTLWQDNNKAIEHFQKIFSTFNDSF